MTFWIECFLLILVGMTPLILKRLINPLENLLGDLRLSVCSWLTNQRDRQHSIGEKRALLLSVLFSEGLQRRFNVLVEDVVSIQDLLQELDNLWTDRKTVLAEDLDKGYEAPEGSFM